MRIVLVIFIFQIFATSIFAQNFKGIILNEDNEPLSYASIYVSETGRGTVSGNDGSFKIDLPNGKSTLQIQYVGYQTINEVVDYPTTKSQTFILPSVVVELGPVQVFSSGENPGMAVMRQAIAKAPYHLNQIDAYTAKVYVKGRGKLDKIPWFLRKAMADGGLDTTSVFISEAISEVKYTRPDKYDEHVISFKANGDENVEPINFSMTNFYEPVVLEKISPLSPKAFRYYTFSLDSYYMSNGKMVNKIKVIPKSKNADLFSGYLHILDDYWSLLSISVEFSNLILDGKVDQTYTEIEQGVYMPIQMKFDADAKVMGVGFQITYLSNVDEYDVTLNPLLPAVKLLEVLDEDEPEEDSQKAKKQPEKAKLDIPKDAPVSIAGIKQILKDFKKIDTVETEFVNEYNQTVDSNALDIDTVLWAKMRPVELTEDEKRGYQFQDSMRIVLENEDKEEESKLFTGNPLLNTKTNIGDWNLDIKTPLLLSTYNLVEGLSLGSRLTIDNPTIDKNVSLQLDGKYGLAWDRFLPKAKLGYKTDTFEIYVVGGRWLNQFSVENPVLDAINSVSILLFNRNFLWQYEKTFLDAKFAYNNNQKYGGSILVAAEQRRAWRNFTDYTFIPNGREKVNFDFNDFDDNFQNLDPVTRIKTTAFIRPWLKISKRNQELFPVNEATTPIFEIEYERAFSGILDGSQTFDRLEGSAKYVLPITPFNRFKHKVVAGGFFNKPSTIENFKFFNGEQNLLTWQTQDFFRIADYYTELPTNGNYLENYFTFSSDRFLLSRIPTLQLFEISEEIFLNVLLLESREYYELGYGLNWGDVLGVDFTVGRGVGEGYSTGLRIKINDLEKILN